MPKKDQLLYENLIYEQDKRGKKLIVRLSNVHNFDNNLRLDNYKLKFMFRVYYFLVKIIILMFLVRFLVRCN